MLGWGYSTLSEGWGRGSPTVGPGLDQRWQTDSGVSCWYFPNSSRGGEEEIYKDQSHQTVRSHPNV